ncbi:hypothetical protein ABIA39_000341 [Nocardia sp. GAS34]|uniref:hypothetical protein n=1 Tax=unclassified Nocardia TaxID=2637762 RepID=UPI003D1FD4B2
MPNLIKVERFPTAVRHPTGSSSDVASGGWCEFGAQQRPEYLAEIAVPAEDCVEEGTQIGALQFD